MNGLRREDLVDQVDERRVRQALIEEDLALLAANDAAADSRPTLEALARAVPPEDLELQRRVLQQLDRRSAWPRWLGLAPLVVSSGVMLMGVGLLGGVPGWSPSGSAGDVSSLVAVMHVLPDAAGVLLDVQRAASKLIPSGVHLVAFGVAVAGGAALAAVRRRQVLQ